MPEIGNIYFEYRANIDPSTGALIGVSPGNVQVGQVVIAGTGTAIPLPSRALVNGVVVKSKASNNAAGATIGAANVTNVVSGAGNGYILAPGDSVTVSVSNSNVLSVNGTVGDIFSFIGN